MRTVQEALREAKALGLLDRHQRVKAARRSLRAVNRYVLKLPEGAAKPPVQPGPHGPGRTTGKTCRGGIQARKQEARESSRTVLATMLAEAARLPDLLAMRRRAFAAGLVRSSARAGGIARPVAITRPSRRSGAVARFVSGREVVRRCAR